MWWGFWLPNIPDFRILSLINAHFGKLKHHDTKANINVAGVCDFFYIFKNRAFYDNKYTWYLIILVIFRVFLPNHIFPLSSLTWFIDDPCSDDLHNINKNWLSKHNHKLTWCCAMLLGMDDTTVTVWWWVCEGSCWAILICCCTTWDWPSTICTWQEFFFCYLHEYV